MSLINANNFIFIHIYKCGGMSLRKTLGEDMPIVEMGLSHYTAKEAKEYCYKNGGEFFWKTAFKFSFVRNPFDWNVSLYEFIRQNSTHENYEEVKNLTFEDFCDWNANKVLKSENNINGKFNTLTDFLFDDDKKLLVDFVGKVENYDDDAKVIYQRLNIKNKDVPKINTTDRERDYRKYYNESSKQTIIQAFYWDLVNFNYQF